MAYIVMVLSWFVLSAGASIDNFVISSITVFIGTIMFIYSVYEIVNGEYE